MAGIATRPRAPRTSFLAWCSRPAAPGEGPRVQPWTVQALGDGRMTCHGPMMTGWTLALGPMTLLACGGVRVVVSTKKVQAMDQEPFRHVGVEPRAERIIAL